jgi:uncharacterized membrane protein
MLLEREDHVSAALDERLAAAEAEIVRLSRRLARLEGDAEPLHARAEPEPSRAPEPLAVASPRTRRPRLDVEELLGGRILALVGGAAVLVGLAFFVALAIDRGWIGEAERVALAFGGSGLLAAAGILLGERRGRTQATLAMVGTGVAGLFLSLTAATALYDLLPLLLAFPVSLAIGALATALAIRWDSGSLAGLGMIGSLAAPVLIGAGPSLEALVFLGVALTASAAVLVWRRWEWLRIAAFAVTVPQLAYWAAVAEPSAKAVVLVLSAFAAIQLAMALGFEVRVPSAALRPSTTLLAALNALILAGLGAVLLHGDHGVRGAGLWVGGVAFAHAVLGAVALRHRRVADEIAILLLGIGLIGADAAFGLLADGAVLAVGWAGSAVVLAAVARRVTRQRELLQLTLGGQLALAVAHALLFDAPPGAVGNGTDEVAGAAGAVLAVAFGAFACARLAWTEGERMRTVLDAVSLASAAYATALVLDGTALVVAWSAQAVALAQVGKRLDDRVVRLAPLAFLALAAAHVLVVEAPPDALAYGVSDLGASALALGALALAAARCRQARRGEPASERTALAVFSGLAVLYLASIAVVEAFQPGSGTFDTGLDVGVRQQGQAVLSALWTLSGLAVLWIGLRERLRALRLAGFGLLTIATLKVFLYDLSTLSSAWRVMSFIVLGLLLLLAALAYQRARRSEGGLPAA